MASSISKQENRNKGDMPSRFSGMRLSKKASLDLSDLPYSVPLSVSYASDDVLVVSCVVESDEQHLLQLLVRSLQMLMGRGPQAQECS